MLRKIYACAYLNLSLDFLLRIFKQPVGHSHAKAHRNKSETLNESLISRICVHLVFSICHPPTSVYLPEVVYYLLPFSKQTYARPRIYARIMYISSRRRFIRCCQTRAERRENKSRMAVPGMAIGFFSRISKCVAS